MHTKTLAPCVALTLLVAGCGGEYVKPIAAVTEPPPNPIDLKDRAPVMTVLSAVTLDMPMGTPIGQLGFGVGGSGCNTFKPITYKSATDQPDMKAYEPVFRDVMGVMGVPVQQTLQRFEGEEIKKADLQVSATIKDLTLNVCYPKPWQDRQLAFGEAAMTVEWAVFSPLERKIVYSTETRGRTPPRIDTHVGAAGVEREAFRDALQTLGAKIAFADTLARKQAPAAARAELITLVQPPPGQVVARLNLGVIRHGAVTMLTNHGEGSGFAIGDGTYVVTAAHLAPGTAPVRMLAVVGGKDQELFGEVVRTDPARDLALIKLTQGKLFPMHVSRDAVRAGQKTYAIGPLGQRWPFSVTSGVVSGFARINYKTYIQSNVSVRHGGSGGPLIDEGGNVIGITAGGVSFPGAPAGTNFFVPATDLFEALSLTITDKK